MLLCIYASHTVRVAVHVIAEGTVGTAGLQLGRVFLARDQTAAQSVNTSQGRSHHRASVMTSAPLGALKTLPVPLDASNTARKRETVRLLRAA